MYLCPLQVESYGTVLDCDYTYVRTYALTVCMYVRTYVCVVSLTNLMV